MLLFIDTETTGIHNAKIIELAALLTDEHGNEMASFNTLINHNVEIPHQATAIHGITTEMCEDYGVHINNALDMFIALHDKCELVVAHNAQFDMRMITEALAGRMFNWKPNHCTMLSSVNVCKLPKANGHAGWKWPKLSEAYEIICDKVVVESHRAMVDVRMCEEIYFKLSEMI